MPAAAIAAAGKRLAQAPTRAILFGRAMTEHPQAAALIAAIECLGWAAGAITAERSSVMYLGPQNDSQGALDMGLTPDRLPGYLPVADGAARASFEKQWECTLPDAPGSSAPEILRAAAEGKIKALWIASDHWLKSAPDRALAEMAMAACELVIVNELFLTETARKAHVVFPVTSFAEKEGVVVNAERRLQRTARAVTPRRGAHADWEIFQAAARSLGAAWSYRSAEDVFREIARLVPGYRGLSWAALMPLGLQWTLPEPLAPAMRPAAAPAADGVPVPSDGLWLLSGGTLFLQGSLSHRETLLPKLAKRALAFLHPAQATKLGLESGDRVRLEGPAGALELPVELDDAVPAGSVFVPYAHAAVELNRLGGPAAAGLRVSARKAAVAERVGA